MNQGITWRPGKQPRPGMCKQKIEASTHAITESGNVGWGQQKTRRTVFQAEETANAKAGKHEECDSLKTGRMCRGLVNKTEVWGVRHRAKARNYGSS